MKVYSGQWVDHVTNVVVRSDGRASQLDPRFYLRKHADKFEWGCNRWGAFQLALALCADALDDDERALEIYRHFVRFPVAEWPVNGGWTFTQAQIVWRIKDLEDARAMFAEASQ